MRNSFSANKRGTTLTELMIATVLITVAALGIMGVFAGVAKGIQVSKSRSLATNLAQEKIQILKQKNYYRVLVTTATVFQTDFTPAIPYDPGYFPPEEIIEGGIRFTRLTYVELAQEVSGTIQTVAATSADTNMKMITVSVLWRQSKTNMRLQVQNVMANPDAVMTNAVIRGKVTCGGTNIRDAMVMVSENSGWQDTTDVNGDYLVNVYPGNYNLAVSAVGYFDTAASVVVSSALAVTQDFALVAMASRTLSGYVWENTHPVISRVMGSSLNASGFSQEFVEIYNPTTWTWSVAGNLGLKFARRAVQDVAVKDIDIDYTASPASIAPGGYYLFANTRPLQLGGAVVMPDAVWDTDGASPNAFTFNDELGRWDSTPGSEKYNVITVQNDFGAGATSAAGGLILYNTGTGETLDRVGWTGNGSQNPHPDVFEGSAIPQAIGLQEEEVYQRKASTTGVSGVWGPAYDSGSNGLDWSTLSPMVSAPFTTASSTKPVLTGIPAVGAVISANDGLSIPVQSTAVGSPPLAQFDLPGVATGTWTVFAARSELYQEIGNAVVPVGAGSIWIPDAATTPAWPAVGTPHVFLSTQTTEGYVLGTVKNISNAPISPAITVTNGSQTTSAATSGSGRYFLRTAAGNYTVSANPGNINGNYVSASSAGVVVSAGQVVNNVDFILTQGGKINGFLTRDGSNGLPGIAVIAQNASGLVESQAVSGADGRFRMANLSTGTYTVEPALAIGEASAPVSRVSTVTVGGDVFAGTFTVTGASGYLRGNVSAGGKPVPTGVTLVVSTAVITGAPPALSTATLSGAAYFVGTSLEDGTYLMEVRGSTSATFRVHAYYPVKSSASWTINVSSVTGVSILPGQTTSGINFSW